MLTRRTLLAAAFWPGLPPAEQIVYRLPASEVVSAAWSEDLDTPAQPGSLWKPFLAAAHLGPSPRYECDGARCWLNRRHGWLDMPGAISQSCNQWFHQLYKTLPTPILPNFGLPPQQTSDWTQWSISPRALLTAYAELLARRTSFPLVIAGLRQAAGQGTAKGLGRAYLAKTGTGPSKRHAGDGWVFAAHPADSPVHLILYRQIGVPGSQAALDLARRLRRNPL